MKVHIVEDHKLFIEGLLQVLKSLGIYNVSYSSNGKEFINWFVDNEDCDLLILDLSMPEMDGFEVMKWLKNKDIILKTLVISSYNNIAFVKKCIEYNAKGYVNKADASHCIEKAIMAIRAGRNYYNDSVRDFIIDKCLEDGKIYDVADFLSTKQKEILRLMINGGTPKEIATKMNITPSTVRTQSSRIREMFNLKTNVGVVKLLYKHGF